MILKNLIQSKEMAFISERVALIAYIERDEKKSFWHIILHNLFFLFNK